MEQLDQRSHNLLREIKKVGPDLKEVRMKMHKEWLPFWLGQSARVAARHQDAAPSAWRTTKCRPFPPSSGSRA